MPILALACKKATNIKKEGSEEEKDPGPLNTQTYNFKAQFNLHSLFLMKNKCINDKKPYKNLIMTP